MSSQLGWAETSGEVLNFSSSKNPETPKKQNSAVGFLPIPQQICASTCFVKEHDVKKK